MYSYVRHPMYGGLLMASLGLSAITNNECRLALSFLLWFVLEQKVVLEERALGELYPGEYAEYKKRVKKFLPYIY
jgi:protein-S-isoprenylcysteine O-methyltransferase Ste14